MTRLRKYLIIILSMLAAMLCAAGVSTWIISTPSALTPQWDKGKDPVWVNRYAEYDYDSGGIALSKLADDIKFCNENGDVLTTSDVAKVNVTNVVATNGDISVQKPQNGKIEDTKLTIGSTYTVSKINITMTGNYILVGTYNGSPGSKVTSDAYYHSTSDDNTEYTIDNFFVKYKTVYGGTPADTKESRTYYTVEDALSTLSGTISLAKGDTSFTALADTETGYSDSGRQVLSGKTLLVPRAENDNGSTTVINDGSKTSYATLHVPKGVNLTVDGTLTINASRSSTGGSTSTVMAHGCMEVKEGGHVEISSNATWYCMGYSYGEGTVNVQSSANVYEPFSMIGWKGGTISAGIRDTVFPLNQFVLASIICKTTFNAGCVYKVRASFTASSANFDPEVTFISKDNNSFLQLQSGTITKWIDEQNGKIHFQSDGRLSFNNIAITFSVIFPVAVSTKDVQVPLPGYFAITLNSGTATIPSGVQLKLLPGATLNINKAATLQVNGGAYAYGKDNVSLSDGLSKWQDGNNKKSYPVGDSAYRITPENGLGFDGGTPAPVTVEGKLIVNKDAKIGAYFDGKQDGQITFNEGAKIQDIGIKEDLSTGDNPSGSDAMTGRGGIFFTSTFKTRGPIWNSDQTAVQSSQFTGNSVWMFTDGGWRQADANNSIKFTINYRAQEGSFASGNTLTEELSMFVDDINAGATIDSIAPAEIPTREFYRLADWYYNENGREYTLEEKALTVHNGDSIDLYAKWEAMPYNITAVVLPSDRSLQDVLSSIGSDNSPTISLGSWQDGDQITLEDKFEQMAELLQKVYGNGYKLIEQWYLATSLTDINAAKQINIINADILHGITFDEQYGIIIVCKATPTLKFSVEYKYDGQYGNDSNFNTSGLNNHTVEDYAGTFGDLIPGDTHFDYYDYNVEKEYYFDGWYVNGSKVVESNFVTLNDLTQENGEFKLILEARWEKKASICIELHDSFSKDRYLFADYNGVISASVNVMGTEINLGPTADEPEPLKLTIYLNETQLGNWTITIKVDGCYSLPGTANGTHKYSSAKNNLTIGEKCTFTVKLEKAQMIGVYGKYSASGLEED